VGDACVLDPIVPEPTFPVFVFCTETTLSVEGVRVTFTRTGGAMLFGPGAAAASDGHRRDRQRTSFPSNVSAGGIGSVVGDLTVELRPRSEPRSGTTTASRSIPASMPRNTPCS